MNLLIVKEEILCSAHEQAKQILSDARKEANRISKEAEKKLEEFREKSDAAAKKAIETIKRQEIAAGELESKKMLLETKKQAIDAAFAEARKSIESLDDKKRGAMLKKLLEKTQKEIDIAAVYCSKKDAKFFSGINTISMEMTGGFIAENKEKTIRVDCSFDSLLQLVRDNEMQNLNNMLFA